MDQKAIKQGIMKDAARMSRDQLDKALAEIGEMERIAQEQISMLESADPFWNYQPSDGVISPEARAFLLEHLRPEDVPQKLDGQLDVHLAMNPIIGASGGNQSGKTTTGCIEALIKATGQLPIALEGVYPKEKMPQRSPQHVRVVGEDYINGILLNLIPTYRKWVPRDWLLDGSWEKSFSAEKSVLTLQRKGQITGTIEFMSNKQEVGSFQGPPRDMMIYDEEPQQDIRQENLLRFTTRDSVNELYCMTPTKGMTWVYAELFSKALENDPSVKWFRLPSVGNRSANLKVLAEIMKNITDYETKKMRLLGEFISLSGLVYGRLFDRRIHVIPAFALEGDWVVFRGLDPHTTKPSVCVELAVNPENQYVVCGVYKEAVDVEVFKKGIKDRAEKKGYRLAWSRCDKSLDSANKLLNDQNVYKMMQRDPNQIPALQKSDKFTGSIKVGVEVIKDLLKVNEISGKPSLVIMDLPETKNLITSFQTLERETFVNEDVKGMKDNIAEGRHDEHAALRYIFQGKPMWIPPPVDVGMPEPACDLTGY